MFGKIIKKAIIMNFHHISVLANESINALNITPEGIYIDGTAGGGGHSSLIAKDLTTGRLLALDKDDDAILAATERLKPYKSATVIKSDFSEAGKVLKDLNIDKINGVLLDLGVSSYQLDIAERGFSYHEDAPLDMRMDKANGISAAEYLQTVDYNTLVRILFQYADEKYAKQITRAMIKARDEKPIETTLELAEIIKNAVPYAYRKKGHPAKKTFMAIRMAVNKELENIEVAIKDLFNHLKIGGRMCIITFHSVEDRLVKRIFEDLCLRCRCDKKSPICTCEGEFAKKITRKPIVPTENEIEQNSRAKSAKLRVIEKVREKQNEI